MYIFYLSLEDLQSPPLCLFGHCFTYLPVQLSLDHKRSDYNQMSYFFTNCNFVPTQILLSVKCFSFRLNVCRFD